MKQLDSVTSVHSPLHDTSMSATKAKSCPRSGYTLFEGFSCYKAFVEGKNWTEARKQCQRDGGDLMVAESDEERYQVLPKIFNSLFSNPWFGVHKPEGCWVTVHGDPIPRRWWAPGEPHSRADLKCTRVHRTGWLFNARCSEGRLFICEIPL
ncbi:hemolymph lipopolysaccharide-binding protein-like [Anabrus simplex]